MVRGIYTAASSMLSIEEQTETTANNLANIDTAGFKRDLLLLTSQPTLSTWRTDDPTNLDAQGRPVPVFIGQTPAGVSDVEVWRDFSAGQIVETGNALDVAIVGDGFLRVLDAGQEFYTRDGQLKQSGDGFIVDNFGRRVQGETGDIFVGGAQSVEINSSGEVLTDGNVAGRLSIANFSDPQQLSKRGGNLWSANAAPDTSAPAEVRGGFLERSNVEAVVSLTEMILNLRHYEANQKVIMAADATMEIAANQIGRLPQ